MKNLVRWSDGRSVAVEFELPGLPEHMAAHMGNAMIEFRRLSSARAELHVCCGAVWSDPIMARATDGHERTHVICSPRLAADVTPYPIIRGTDFVLVVGPGNWHGDAVWRGAMEARRASRRFNQFTSDVVNAIGG